MEFGESKPLTFSEYVYFNGIINTSAKGMTNISLSIPGKITAIHCNIGQYVHKNDALFEIGGNEFIDLQRDFAATSANLVRLKSEYERANDLFKEKIGTQKEFMLIENAYKTELATFTALKIKLNQLNLDISKIEKGEFYSSYKLKSAGNGYISTINVSVGQHLEPNFVLAEIIDPQSFQLKIGVFEKDIQKLKNEQKIEFYLGDNMELAHKATLKTVGKTIDNESKAINCYAQIDDLKNLTLVNKQYVTGKVIVGSHTALSLPETAILKVEKDNYILKLDKETDDSYFFSKIQVHIGSINQGNIELIDAIQMEKVLINGIYNINIE
jgi:cobalt-zinc-cadmium efflux system membrane fusion protein